MQPVGEGIERRAAGSGRDPWRPAPTRPRLSREEVHVWRATLSRADDEVEALRALLSEDEADRAGRFHFQRDRTRFTVARATLRQILGSYLSLPPQLLRFEYNEFGKPTLSDAPLSFNLSHAGDVALYAVARGREVGVDIEAVREGVGCEELAARFFSRGEAETLLALPPEARTRAFFDCWTRKEAYVKALGSGLSQPLDGFDVSLAPGEPAALLRSRADAREAARWTLRELSPGDGYAAAVAVEGGGWRLLCWDFD
jgi:4'-phosphopantetheinyl transferase